MATFFTVRVSVWCVDCLDWLRSVEFVCECLVCGRFGVATFCTVCLGVSGVWTV
jgi:hypothetical protein